MSKVRPVYWRSELVDFAEAIVPRCVSEGPCVSINPDHGHLVRHYPLHVQYIYYEFQQCFFFLFVSCDEQTRRRLP